MTTISKASSYEAKEREQLTRNILKGGYGHPFFQKAEKDVLDPLGKIPIVSTFTGPIRCAGGSKQFLGYGILSFFKVLGCFFHLFDSQGLKRQLKDTTTCVCNSGHGIANIVRGSVETVPLLGNITTALYDGCGLKIDYPYAQKI